MSGPIVSMTVSGGPELAAKLARLGEAVSSQVMANALLAGALVIEASAKEKAPVLTGNLRRSIGVAVAQTLDTGSLYADIGTDVEYAPYQEFGTRFMAAQPYLRPAFDEKKGEAQNTIRDALKQLIEAAAR
ncbi:MAG TPA: HK97-gp10 family putative phage morphogenesis protein [Dehalococcoidia bacterium]